PLWLTSRNLHEDGGWGGGDSPGAPAPGTWVDGVVRGVVTAVWTVFVLPIPWLVFTSLRPARDVFSTELFSCPERWKWQNYVEVWTKVGFGSLMLNSIVVALLVVLGQVVTSTITGFTLARLSFRGRSLIVWGYMVSMLVPAHLTLVPSFRILTSLGLIDT